SWLIPGRSRSRTRPTAGTLHRWPQARPTLFELAARASSPPSVLAGERSNPDAGHARMRPARGARRFHAVKSAFLDDEETCGGGGVLKEMKHACRDDAEENERSPPESGER